MPGTHYTPDDDHSNERIEYRLEGSRWVPVITAYEYHDQPVPPDDEPVDDEPSLTLEEEIELLKLQVAELEYQLSRSFLLID